MDADLPDDAPARPERSDLHEALVESGIASARPMPPAVDGHGRRDPGTRPDGAMVST